MKVLIIIILFTLSAFNSIRAQWRVMPAISVSQNLSIIGGYSTNKVSLHTGYHYNSTHYISYNAYQITNINGGVNLANTNYSIGIKAGYQFFICRDQTVTNPYVKNKFIMNSHFIGFVITNRFRENKIVRPFINISGSTEVKTNYRDRYLSTETYNPTVISSGNYDNVIGIKTNFYQSTPFIGSLLIGCDFRIYKDLRVNLALGYGLRVLKTRYGMLTFHPEQSTMKPVKTEYISEPYTVAFHMLDFQLGLSYAFSFKKKEKQAK